MKKLLISLKAATKKVLIPIVFGVIALVNISMFSSPGEGILDKRDIELAKNEEPALTSAPGDQPAWESRSEWQCFPIEAVEIRYVKYCKPEGCSPETDFDVPSIDAEYGGHSYEFDFDVEFRHDNEKILSEWKNLMQAQKNICIYAAMLPSVAISPSQPNVSLWALYNIKTLNGVWRKDYSPYRELPDSVPSEKSFGDYRVKITRASEDLFQKLTILKNEKIVYEDFADHIEFGNHFDESVSEKDPYSGKDLNNRKVQNLVISSSDGGAHGCYSLSIFELGDTLRKVTTVDGGSYEISLVDLDRDGIPEIEFWDGAIDYRFSSFGGSAPGRVVLKFVEDHYEVALNLMEKPLSNPETLDRAKREIKEAFQKDESSDLPYEFLHLMMDLSYEGHLKDALVIASETWPSGRPDFEKFKSNFQKALQLSSYWPKVRQQ